MQPNGQDVKEENKMPVDQPTELYTPTPMSDDSVKSVDGNDNTPSVKDDDEPIHWQSEEYVQEKKGGLWFIFLIIFALGFIALDVFIMKSYTFSVLVIVMVLALIVYSRRPPKVIDYTLSGAQGLYVGEKLYHFSEFKEFGVIKDHNGRNSIMLIPIKRFSLGVSVYFPDELGEKIVDIFGARLPMKTMKLDTIDIIIRKLHL